VERSAAHDRAAIAVGAAFLLLYRLTAAPGLLFADSAEFQTVGVAGGIPHATGYPLWVALAHAFTWLPLGAPEFRVTLFSAVGGAIALGLLVRRLGEMGVGLAASVTAACFLGATFSFWRVSVRAEVYTLSAIVALVVLGALLRAMRGASTARGPALRAGFLLGLVMTGHLAFAPLVAVAGLALAWREWRAAPRDLARLPLVAGAFLLGLTPYLLLVALDAGAVRANYLDLVREMGALMRVDEPPIDSPWQGVAWLVTGRNVYPPEPFGFHPRSVAAMLPNALAALFLFELGPVALPLAIVGFVRHHRRAPRRAALLAAACGSSLVFAAWLQFGAMLHLFLFPAILFGAFFVADGLDAAFAGARRAARGAPGITLASVAAWAALALTPALLRVHADRHPIGPAGWRVTEEDVSFRAGFIPGMQGDRRAETWARAALDSFPRGARVVATWTYYTPLRHLQIVEGLRPDLTLRQLSQQTLEARVREWQRADAASAPPLVFAAGDPRFAPWIAGADSIPLPGGRHAYLLTRNPR